MPDDATPPNLSSIARAVEPPPEDFDALTAPTELLLRHGLPRRPDPEREPSLAGIWAHVLARPIRWVRAELEVDPIMSARARTRASRSDFSIGDWAGVAIDTTKVGNGDPAIMVFAEWVVPTVLALGPASGFGIGFWVGIDGLFSVGGQILQAGIGAELDGSDINYWAFTEWFPNDAVRVNNDPGGFRVGPGDSVSFWSARRSPIRASSR